MVGTLYFSPSPDDPAFVKVGDRVDENTVLCIIEAMKVMMRLKRVSAELSLKFFARMLTLLNSEQRFPYHIK